MSTWKLVPETVITLRGRQSVIGSAVYPPGSHPAGCPLIPECHALEVKTSAGSRWYGVQEGRITSALRMAVRGFNPRFEEMSAWEDSTEIVNL